jgi:hypothetical protein
LDQETIEVRERSSSQAQKSGIIVTAAETSSYQAKLVVGRPGFPNVVKALEPGGALLYETPDGLFEIRVMATYGTQVTVLLSHISPRQGIKAGFVDQDSENSPFTSIELTKIKASITEIERSIRARSDVSPEKVDFIARKLDYMQQASERMGRKDWINLALGTLSSAVAAAALPPDAARALFMAADAALSWLFGGGMTLLPPM